MNSKIKEAIADLLIACETYALHLPDDKQPESIAKMLLEAQEAAFINIDIVRGWLERQNELL